MGGGQSFIALNIYLSIVWLYDLKKLIDFVCIKEHMVFIAYTKSHNTNVAETLQGSHAKQYHMGSFF